MCVFNIAFPGKNHFIYVCFITLRAATSCQYMQLLFQFSKSKWIMWRNGILNDICLVIELMQEILLSRNF
jgi:hypothetical protein